jgi:hypothetical protein
VSVEIASRPCIMAADRSHALLSLTNRFLLVLHDGQPSVSGHGWMLEVKFDGRLGPGLGPSMSSLAVFTRFGICAISDGSLRMIAGSYICRCRDFLTLLFGPLRRGCARHLSHCARVNKRSHRMFHSNGRPLVDA